MLEWSPGLQWTPRLAAIAVGASVLAWTVGCGGENADEAGNGATAPAAAASGDEARTFDLSATVETVAELDPEKLLGEVIAAYRAAPALTDQLLMTYSTRTTRLQTPFEATIKIDQNGDALFATPRTTLCSVDGKAYLTLTNSNGRYVQTDLIDGDIKRTMRRALRASGAIPHHFSIRTDRPRAAIIRDITLEMLTAPSASSAELLRNAYGDEAERLRITSVDGSMDVYIDPKTKLIIAADATVPQPSDPSQEMIVNIRYSPQVMDALSEPITFSTAGMMQVESARALASLDPPAASLAPGSAAPEFSIVDAEGSPVSLADLRGSYVVLTFWATWCKPCEDAMTQLDQVAAWARTSGVPMKLYGVNVQDTAATEIDRRKKADAFWDMQQLGYPTLIDIRGQVENDYQVISVPSTLVIDPDGAILQRFTGPTEGLEMIVEQLITESWSDRNGGS